MGEFRAGGVAGVGRRRIGALARDHERARAEQEKEERARKEIV